MKETKKLFWTSIFMIIIGVVLILIFEVVLPSNEQFKKLQNIMVNISCSLLVSAIVLSCTSYISFMAKRKIYMYRYYSLIHELRNCVLDVINWCEWNDDMLNNDYSEIECNKFVNKLNKIKHFKFDQIYNITDDFCSLRLIKENKILIKMKELLSFIQTNYNIHYNKELNHQLWLVEEQNMPKQILCREVMRTKFNSMNHEENLKNINSLFVDIMNDSGIIEYEKKTNKNNII